MLIDHNSVSIAWWWDPGDKFIHARKLRKGAENIYETTDVDFFLNCEDVRFDDGEVSGTGCSNMAHKEVTRTQRSKVVTSTKRFELNKREIQTLQHRCWRPPA